MDRNYLNNGFNGSQSPNNQVHYPFETTQPFSPYLNANEDISSTQNPPQYNPAIGGSVPPQSFYLNANEETSSTTQHLPQCNCNVYNTTQNSKSTTSTKQQSLPIQHPSSPYNGLRDNSPSMTFDSQTNHHTDLLKIEISGIEIIIRKKSTSQDDLETQNGRSTKHTERNRMHPYNMSYSHPFMTQQSNR